MKGSLIIVGAFLVGCLTGRTGLLPDSISEGDISLWVLYALMFQVGIGIGADKRLKEILRTLSPRMLLIPAATIVGTLAAAGVVSFALSRWSSAEVPLAAASDTTRSRRYS